MRKLKDYTALTIRLDKKIDKQLTEFCDSTRMTKTATVEKALEKYLEEFKKTGRL